MRYFWTQNPRNQKNAWYGEANWSSKETKNTIFSSPLTPTHIQFSLINSIDIDLDDSLQNQEITFIITYIHSGEEILTMMWWGEVIKGELASSPERVASKNRPCRCCEGGMRWKTQEGNKGGSHLHYFGCFRSPNAAASRGQLLALALLLLLCNGRLRRWLHARASEQPSMRTARFRFGDHADNRQIPAATARTRDNARFAACATRRHRHRRRRRRWAVPAAAALVSWLGPNRSARDGPNSPGKIGPPRGDSWATLGWSWTDGPNYVWLGRGWADAARISRRNRMPRSPFSETRSRDSLAARLNAAHARGVVGVQERRRRRGGERRRRRRWLVSAMASSSSDPDKLMSKADKLQVPSSPHLSRFSNSRWSASAPSDFCPLFF